MRLHHVRHSGLFCLLLASVLPAQSPASAILPPTRPTLVVVITVDQLRQESLQRFRGEFTGGFKRLLERGAVFTNAFHDHATTETAPGHSTILSGRFPRSTGIVRNSAGVLDARAPLLGARGPGASPYRFRGSTLVDWLRLDNPRSRALSVSYKDRGAILPIGRSPEDVYWYAAQDGRFTTSTYYGDTLPGWVQQFNSAKHPHQFAGRRWTPIRPDSAFEYTVPLDTMLAVAAVGGTPWMDDLTLNFAMAGVRAMELGAGPATDVLAISLSATDLIGHRFGPDTKEANDQLFRLDRTLGKFFDTLLAMRDSTRVLIALTADHGVAPLPERRFAGQPAGTGRVNLRDLVTSVSAALAMRGIDSSAFAFEYGMVVVDRPALSRGGVNADSLLSAFIADVRKRPGVLRVDRVADLARADTVRDAIARRWYHALPPDIPVAAVVTLQPYHYWSDIMYATHGTPHDYDAHVPLIFYGPTFHAGVSAQFVRVVDLAPTLAEALDLQPTEKLDGRSLMRREIPGRAKR